MLRREAEKTGTEKENLAGERHGEEEDGRLYRSRKRRPEARVLENEINRFFDLAEAEGRLVLLEDLLRYLGMTRSCWNTLRESGKSARSRETAEIIMCAEQRFTSLILHAAAANPRLTTLAVYLTKQPCYGGYADRAATSQRGQPEIVVRLDGASEPFD